MCLGFITYWTLSLPCDVGGCRQVFKGYKMLLHEVFARHCHKCGITHCEDCCYFLDKILHSLMIMHQSS